MSRHYRNVYGESVSEFSKAELGDLVRPMGEETDAERRLRELQERNAELQRALGAVEDEQEHQGDIDALERRNRELEAELRQRTTTKQLIEDQMMNTDLQALNTLDTLAKSATADHAEVAKRCSDLMEARIDAISKDRGVGRSLAHRIAAKSDGVYKQAYAIHMQSYERALQQHSMVAGMGAHF